MNPTLSLVLKILACGAFGLAVMLIVVGVYYLTRGVRLEAGASTMVSMRRNDMRQRALRKSALWRLLLPWIQLFSALLVRFDLASLREYVSEPYARAGYPGGLDDDEVVALGFILGLGIAAFIAFSTWVFVGGLWMAIGVAGIPIGYIVLVSNLKTRAHLREIQILQGLPYLLDLLVLMLRSGTSLRLALTRVVADYDDHPIGVEFGQVLAEIEVGAVRVDAFKRMSDRLKIQDVTSLTDSIVQSEELGWPLAETLERLADRLSAERILRAQAAAGAAGVLVMLPSTLVLAAAVLLLFSPIIVRILRNGLGLQ